MPGFLIINPHSGAGAGADELLAAAASRGIDTHVFQADEESLTELAHRADAEAIGMAGGDGSLAVVASVCIERGLPFVCVPFGTKNHFARDLGLDRNDPVAALDAFDNGKERWIDVGRVGDRLFLNNVSLGIYARLVHAREHHRRQRDLFARLRALGIVARHPRPARITIGDEPAHARIVLVANNRYELGLFSFGARERLDEGRLHLYLPRGMVRAGWEEQTAERLVVDSGRHRLEAAVDGEPIELQTPIELRIEPRALRLLAPQSTSNGADTEAGPGC